MILPKIYQIKDKKKTDSEFEWTDSLIGRATTEKEVKAMDLLPEEITYGNNNIDLEGQQPILEELDLRYFNANLPPVTESTITVVAEEIIHLALMYQNYGGELVDLDLSNNIPNPVILNILRQRLGEDVDISPINDEGSGNGGNSGNSGSSPGSSSPGSCSPPVGDYNGKNFRLNTCIFIRK